jgi:hypothetical protein
MSDTSAAHGFIQEAIELIANRDYDRANAKLELADVEAEDLTGDARASVLTAIADARARVAQAQAELYKPKYLRTLRNLMDSAESDIGNLVTWPGTERQLLELFSDATAMAAIPEEMAAAQPKFNTFRKLHARKAITELAAQIERDVANAEEQWAETRALFEDEDSSPNGRSYSADRTSRYIDDARRRLTTQLPADHEAAIALSARLDAISVEFAAMTQDDATREILEQLARQIDLYADDFDGWEDETDAPTWSDYRGRSSEAMSAFLAPRTREFRERMESLLEQLQDDDEYQAVADTAAVKSVMDGVRDRLARAQQSLRARVEAIVAQAESVPVTDPSALDRLESDVRRALGYESSDAEALAARVQAKREAFAQGESDAEETREAQIAQLRARADAVWPDLYAGMQWSETIDLDQVGQQIGFLADNLMGWRFQPGDFYYATTLGGRPVVGTFSPEMRNGIRAVEQLLERSLGDDDDDGKWDCVARVTEKRVRLMAKRSAESTGSVGGIEVQVHTDYAEPVEAVVIEMLAARCGPFAGATGRGVLAPDGTLHN